MGKSQLSNIITQKFPSHKTYIELFAGAAWVFFRKLPSKYEVINDRDGDLVSFYWVLQNHLEEFIKQFKWLLLSRQWWEEWNKQLDAGGLTDTQKNCQVLLCSTVVFRRASSTQNIRYISRSRTKN